MTIKKYAENLPSEVIRRQLQLLIGCEELKKSAVLVKFLLFVVETTLTGNEEEIKEYTIGVRVLGRNKDFNPQLDAIVRIHATRLRRALSDYYCGSGKDDPVIIGIPKGGYVPNFQINILSKSKDLSPCNDEAEKAEMPKLQVPASLKQVLAVLPFRDLSPEPFDSVFIAALGEDISLQLAKFDNMFIISFNMTKGICVSGDKILTGADYILAGSVLLLNETVKLNVQLTSVANSHIVWSDSFMQHEVNEVSYGVFDDIISNIAKNVTDRQKIINKQNTQLLSFLPETTLPVSAAV